MIGRGGILHHMIAALLRTRSGSFADIDATTNAVMEAFRRQNCVSELLHEEGNGPINVHRRPVRVYEAVAVDASTVRRLVHWFESGDKDVDDKARS